MLQLFCGGPQFSVDLTNLAKRGLLQCINLNPLFATQAVTSQMPSSAELASLYSSLAQHDAPTTRGSLQPVPDLHEQAWPQQRLPPIGEPMEGLAWESPRGSLDLNSELGDGNVRGGNSRHSSMPAYTLDYTGNVRAASQQLRGDSLTGSMANRERQRRSADISTQAHTLHWPSYDESARRASADEAR